MKISKDILCFSLILVITIATIALPLAAIPTANAQPPSSRKKTYAYIGLIPDQVGVNQETLIHIGIYTATANIYNPWTGLIITVTAPDDTTQTLGPFATDATGGTGTTFVPTQVGTYSLQSHFPEQVNPVTFRDMERGVMIFAGTVMEASDSEVVDLVVTEEPIEYYPGVPLPSEFWSRPIDSQFREWSGIAGNWLETPKNKIALHNNAPETAHILWAKRITTGGLVGGTTGEHGMETGDAYEGKFQDSIIMNGILYYHRFGSKGAGLSGPIELASGVIAVDLRTGEELWFRNNTVLSFGQNFYFDSWNCHGVYDYLWEIVTVGGGRPPAPPPQITWNAYDPFTGEWVYSITDVPTGLRYTGPNGEFYIAVVDLENGWMALWNQTACSQQLRSGPDLGSWGRFVHGLTFNGSNPKCYSWNVTIPTDLPIPNYGFMGGAELADDRVLGVNISPSRDKLTLWALSLKPGQEGQVIFNTEWNPPAEWATGVNVIYLGGVTSSGDGGVFTIWNKELRKHYAFSLDTGSFLWETEPEHYLQALGGRDSARSWLFSDDKFYSIGVAGILYCYDINDGSVLWTYNAADPYNEFLFGNDWWSAVMFISDGKIYFSHLEHSSIDPKPRGAPFTCLDAETGEMIWTVDGMFRHGQWGGGAIIGDSIIATMDVYDQRLYAVGKGPSQTTVTAPDVGVMEGSSIMIKGTVMDIAAGTTTPELAARFPNGVPAVSDESMSEWMAYVYKLFPMPTVVGVEVTLDVVDSNGNFRNIGTATTDASGFFYYQWTPDIPGDYLLLATFVGSGGYYPSYAETAFGVDQVPEATPAPTATPTPQTETYIAGSTIAILAGIAIAVFLILRKK